MSPEAQLDGFLAKFTPDVEALIAESLERAAPPIDPAQPGRLIVKSISAKQRPRRPST